MAQISGECLELITYYEGFRGTAYRDPVGVLTIGYGHTGPDVHEGMTITEPQARDLLHRRIEREFLPGVLAAIGGKAAKQCELDAMVSLAYNIGVGAFRTSTLVKRYVAGDKQGAADEFLRWHYAGGRSLLGLRRRRHAERLVFLGTPAKDAIRSAFSVQ